MRGALLQRTAPRWQEYLNVWPLVSKTVAEALIDRYDAPHAAAADYLSWNFNSPWRRTVLYRRGRVHNFPRPHEDVLKQVIGFQIPADKITAVLAFCGSLLISRPDGELTAWCGSEEMNRVMLNLAHDIVVDKKTVTEARRAAARMIHFIDIGWPEPYAQALLFTLTDDLIDSLHYAANSGRKRVKS